MADWPVAVLWSEAVKPQAGQIGEEQEERFRPHQVENVSKLIVSFVAAEAL